MTGLDLAAIRERAHNATPGPWEADRPQVWGPNGESVAFVSSHDPGEVSGQPAWEAHAVFIAHARDDVPALLDLVETLASRLNAVRELLDGPLGEDDECTISRDELRAALDGDQ